MQAESLEVLEKAEVAPAQARAIVRAIEIEMAGARDTVATKYDLSVLGQGLAREIRLLREQIFEWRGELKAEIHTSASSTTRQVYMALLGQMAVLLVSRTSSRPTSVDGTGQLRN